MQAEMGASMKKMRAQMAALAKTADPKERARLLDEHTQTMMATMQGMRKGGGMMMSEGRRLRSSPQLNQPSAIEASTR